MAEERRPEVVWGEDSSPPEAFGPNQVYAFVDTAPREIETEMPPPVTGYTVWARGPDGDMVRVGGLAPNPDFEEMPPARPAETYEARLSDEYEARQRAKLLLRRFCTPEQWAEYAEHQRLTVETERSVFVLTQDRTGGVEQVPKSPDGVALRHRARRWCIHTGYDFPVEDMILAQKLAIENDEEAFLRRANPIYGAYGYGYGGARGRHVDHVHDPWGAPAPPPHEQAARIIADVDDAPAYNALTALLDATRTTWDELGRRVQGTVDGMLERMRVVLAPLAGPRPERGSCCENHETQEADGNWCRRAFSRFFEPPIEEGRLSAEEAREAERERRSPVPVGSERRRE